ncbi:MAG: hypothetical protein ACI9UA_002882 [Pseudoalteromonas tetraodonis]|jgi:hypothetical protein
MDSLIRERHKDYYGVLAACDRERRSRQWGAVSRDSFRKTAAIRNTDRTRLLAQNCLSVHTLVSRENRKKAGAPSPID